MKINDSDLFFTCSLIELIGRSTKQKRSAVVALLGEKILSHIYSNAGVLHCEPIAKNADAFIEMCNIPEGTFDNVADCKYEVPDYWTIGKVFARLIEDVTSGNAIETLQEVYSSPVCDAISNYNSDFFYQPRGFIKEFYLDECKNSPQKRKTPALRFAGFTDAWEQRKLGDVGTFYYGHSCPKWSVTEDATTPCIRYGELYTKFGSIVDRVYSYTTIPSEKLRFSKGTEVLIPRVGEDPMDYNHCTWLSLKGIAIGEMISVFNSEQNPLFSAIMFNATLQQEFAIRVEGGSVTNLYYEKLKNIEVKYPSALEQKKIAAFFQSLDRLITLHQRKYDKLTKVKKSMLEKMFPKNGSDVPEIRFSGFSDAWEQRKLGEICNSFSYGLNAAAKPYDGENKYIRITDIADETRVFSQEDLTSPDIDLNKAEQYKLQAGDIVFARTGASVGKTYLFDAQDGTVYYAGFLIRAKVNKDNSADFVFQATLSEQYRRFITITSQRSGQPGVNAQEYSEWQLFIPHRQCEQEKIGQFFKSLDRLITLHQRELDRLQKIKKSCLEKMFV